MNCEKKEQNHNFCYVLAPIGGDSTPVLFCTSCGEVRKLELPKNKR